MSALLLAVQDRLADLLADLLIRLFTAVNQRVDVLRWFCGPVDALEPV